MKAICIKNNRDWSWSMVRYCPNWMAWFWIFWYQFIRLYDNVEAREVSK